MFNRNTSKHLMLAVLSAGLMVPAAMSFGTEDNSNQQRTGADQPANQGAAPGTAGNRAPNNANTNTGVNDSAQQHTIDRDSAHGSAHGSAKLDDKQFAMKAAEGGLAEVKLGELAQKQASADDVKRFGQRMVDDHGKANDELKQVVRDKGVTVPTELKGEEKEHYEKLAKLNGAEFDRAYIKHMVMDHEKDIQEFKDEARDGKDPEIRAWASKTLPTLQEHAKMIDRVAQANGVEGARTASERQSPDTARDSKSSDRSNSSNTTNSDRGTPPNQGNTGADTQRPGDKPQK